jgi:hypothetical protein
MNGTGLRLGQELEDPLARERGAVSLAVAKPRGVPKATMNVILAAQTFRSSGKCDA